MVPVAADGTVFSRDCAYADGSFRVGTKEQNTRLESFDEALAALRAMDVPRWRRPGATTGVTGLVIGVSWIAVSDERR